MSISAYQVEGGIKNDWSEWEKLEIRSKKLEDKNPVSFICGQACDSYNRYEEDLNLVNELNCNAYRVGLEWARIEPEEGKFSKEAIEHYRKMFLAFKERNIKAVVTLWHWTVPVWFRDKGGWEKAGNVKYFSRYAEMIAKELGGLIDLWLTMNEPMIYLTNGYRTAKWPPNKKSWLKFWRAYNNLVKAHKLSYGIIHKHPPAGGSKAKVGLTMLTNYFEAASKWCPVEWALAKLANHCWNDRFIKKLGGQYDFLGLDYYFHDRIVWYPPFIKNENKKITDLGWEIYPKGIYAVLKNYAKFKKPLYIMENGLADSADKYRAEFITDHLRYVLEAIKDGVKVKGYFHWSLLDNFEWSSGFAPKFGLYSVDRTTFARSPRPSAKIYSEICKNNGVKVK